MKTKYLWVVVMLVTMVQPAVCQTFDETEREELRKEREEMKAMQEKERREVVEELRKTGIKELRSLSFSTSGSIINSGVYYELTSDDGQYAVKIKLDGQSNGEAKKYLISDEKVKELIKLFNQYEVWEWNGFEEHHPEVMDGSSFYFSLTVQNGKKINAYGYMMYPEHFGEVIPEMIRILDEGKGEEVEETFSVTKICSLYYSSSGGVLYRLICDDECTVSFTNEEAKTYPVSDEQKKELIDLFNKYKIWKWSGFDKCDYNAEGDDFVFVLDVQDGKEINATGYGMYPMYYEEVTREMIRILNQNREDISEEDEEDEEDEEVSEVSEVSEEKGDSGFLVPVIIGAAVFIIVLVVIGIVRRRR